MNKRIFKGKVKKKTRKMELSNINLVLDCQKYKEVVKIKT